MMNERRTPLIQTIVPNVQDYLHNVQSFYIEKIQLIMYRIKLFIEVANELAEIPGHLSLQFKSIRKITKMSQEERQIEQMMVKNEIDMFLGLKSEVVQFQTGNKFLYPQLPKVQRNIRSRKNSKAESVSSDSQKNDNSDSIESVDQISNLLGTLNLESKISEQICHSIQNMIIEMSSLNLEDESQPDQTNLIETLQNNNAQSSISLSEQKISELYEIKKRKKYELFKLQYSLEQNGDQLFANSFKKVFNEKLQQIGQLFRVHLENSVQDVVQRIKQILFKALSDIKNQQNAYVPLHKVSSYFYKLNSLFYRCEGVIKCLHKYLTKKIKECVSDSFQTFHVDGQEMKIKTNFKLRFLKHIFIEYFFFIWLKNAVADLNKMVKEKNSFEDHKPTSSQKIQQESPEKETKYHDSQFHHQDMAIPYSLRKNNHQFDNFIM